MRHKKLKYFVLTVAIISQSFFACDSAYAANGSTGCNSESADSVLVNMGKLIDPSLLYEKLKSAPSRFELPEYEVERMTHKFEKLVSTSRYMERNCVPSAYEKWEGFPLSLCSYKVMDKDSTVKNAKVIMLNPSPVQMARWVVAACIIVKGCADSVYNDQIYKHIRMQSGAQFPVSGIVYEDMEGDGKYKVYCFRNGVTVKVKGIKHAGILPLNNQQIDSCLYSEIDSSWTGQFARIQSTSREQYKAIGGNIDVGDKDNRKTIWLDVVRDLYKEAWKSDINILLIAWAYVNLK